MHATPHHECRLPTAFRDSGVLGRVDVVVVVARRQQACWRGAAEPRTAVTGLAVAVRPTRLAQFLAVRTAGLKTGRLHGRPFVFIVTAPCQESGRKEQAQGEVSEHAQHSRSHGVRGASHQRQPALDPKTFEPDDELARGEGASESHSHPTRNLAKSCNLSPRSMPRMTRPDCDDGRSSGLSSPAITRLRRPK